MKILILDNYDSFTYNIISYLKKLNYTDIDVHLNDKIKLIEIEKYDKIILSPGPGLPKEAGVMMDLIEKYYTQKDILGICLGHQAIGEFFGSKLKNLKKVKHGFNSKINILNRDNIFKNIQRKIDVGHYHSWVIDENNTSKKLEILAKDKDDLIMAVKHKDYNIFGLQFHLESILTEYGEKILDNWLKF